MKIILVNGSNVPLFEQIKNAIKENIINRSVEDGEQLPSVRALSKELKVSILTVKKAYDELAEEGYIDIRQGLGTFVGENNASIRLEEKQKQLEANIAAAIRISKDVNLDEKSFMDLVKYLYEVEEDGE